MSKNTWLGLLLLSVVFAGIALIDAGAKKTSEWRERYIFKDKIPFGTYVLREEIPHTLSEVRTLTNFGESNYELMINRDSTEEVHSAIVDISEFHSTYDYDTEVILDYVENGGEVFMSGKSFSDEFLDTLGLYFELLDYAKFRPTPKSVFYTLGADTTKVFLDKV